MGGYQNPMGGVGGGQTNMFSGMNMTINVMNNMQYPDNKPLGGS